MDLATLFSIDAEVLSTPSSLFSPNLIDQSACRILPHMRRLGPLCMMIDQSGMGENILDKALKHLAAILPNSRLFALIKTFEFENFFVALSCVVVHLA